MTTEEKADLWDRVLLAMTHQWESGEWSWWCCTVCGGPARITAAEAQADFVAWATKTAKRKAGQGDDPGKDRCHDLARRIDPVTHAETPP